MKNFYSTFTKYYCQLLNTSILSEKQFKCSKSYLLSLLKHKNLLINLSCNFRDESFVMLLNNMLEANSDLMMFVKYVVEAYLKCSGEILAEIFAKSFNSSSKSLKKNQGLSSEARIELEKIFLINIVLNDLIGNITNSKLEIHFCSSKAHKQFIEESAKQLLSFYNQIASKLDFSNKSVSSSIEELFKCKGYSILSEDGTFIEADSYTKYLFETEKLEDTCLFKKLVKESRYLIENEYPKGVLNFSNIEIKREVKFTIFAGPKVYSEFMEELLPEDSLNTTTFEKGYIDFMSKHKTLDVVFMFGVENKSGELVILMEVILARNRQCFEEYFYNIS